MPILHEYIDGRGYYIRHSFKGKIVTYRVTPAGIEYVKKQGYRDSSEINPRELDWMRKKKFIFTGGAGPGTINDADIENHVNRTKTWSASMNSETSYSTIKTPAKSTNKRVSPIKQVLIVVFLLVILVAICSQCT
jgi:hypothetical protein